MKHFNIFILIFATVGMREVCDWLFKAVAKFCQTGCGQGLKYLLHTCSSCCWSLKVKSSPLINHKFQFLSYFNKNWYYFTHFIKNYLIGFLVSKQKPRKNFTWYSSTIFVRDWKENMFEILTFYHIMLQRNVRWDKEETLEEGKSTLKGNNN